MTDHGANLNAVLAALAKATDRATVAAAEANAAADRAEAAIPAPAPVTPTPDVPGKLPEHVQRSDTLKNKSAENVYFDQPGGYAIHNSKAGVYRYDNLEVFAPGGDPWQHGVYQSRGELHLGRSHFYGPRRKSPGGRDHLAFYASGASIVTTETLMIGHPTDIHAHDFPMKVKSKLDADRRVHEVNLKTVIAYGGGRVLFNAGNDKGGGSPVPDSIPAAAKIRLGTVVVIDPVGGSGGDLDLLRFADCPDVEIGTLIAIDRQGRVTGDVRLAEIKRSTVVAPDVRVHLPNAITIGGLVHTPIGPPTGPMPVFDLGNAHALLEWAGVAE